MQHELVLKAITHGTIGVIFLALLLVLLFALRKDIKGRKPLRGIVIFALAILGLWCFLAFAEVYVNLQKIIAPQPISEQPDTTGIAQSVDFSAVTVLAGRSG
ncbi:MAG: hypothetical protein ACREQV_21655 [Candidatus Binatia bacterium]